MQGVSMRGVITASTPGVSRCSFLMKFSDFPFINGLKIKSPLEFDIVPSHIYKTTTRRKMSELYSYVLLQTSNWGKLFKIKNPIA